MREIAFESVTAKEKLRPPRSQAYVLHDPTSLVSRSRPFRQFFFSFFTVCFFLLLPFPLFWQPMTASWTSRVRLESSDVSLFFLYSTLPPFSLFFFLCLAKALLDNYTRETLALSLGCKHGTPYGAAAMLFREANVQILFSPSTSIRFAKKRKRKEKG